MLQSRRDSSATFSHLVPLRVLLHSSMRVPAALDLAAGRMHHRRKPNQGRESCRLTAYLKGHTASHCGNKLRQNSSSWLEKKFMCREVNTAVGYFLSADPTSFHDLIPPYADGTLIKTKTTCSNAPKFQASVAFKGTAAFGISLVVGPAPASSSSCAFSSRGRITRTAHTTAPAQ